MTAMNTAPTEPSRPRFSAPRWPTPRGLWLAATALALTACAESAPEEAQPAIVQNEVALTRFDTCTALEQYLEDTAVQRINVHLDNIKYGRSYWWGGFGAEVDGAVPPTASRGGDTQDTASNAPQDYTTTNTQVADVDEADFVKTNGTHIFVLSGQKLYMTKSWPAEEMALVDAIEIEGYPREMFLDEHDNIVVFSSFHPGWSADDVYWCQWGCGYEQMMTKVTVLGLTNGKLQPTHQIYLQGRYANARRVDASVRVVLRDELPLPEGVRWYPDFNGDPQQRQDDWYAAVDALKASNETLIRARTLDDWLPVSYYLDDAGRRVDLPRDCGSFRRSNAPVRLGIASIGTINLTGGVMSLSSTSILGEVGEVYASAKSLYIASPHWWWWPAEGQRSYTYLHKFDISDSDRAAYSASGVVAGYPLNQFSMDEHRGYFRVATTIDEWFRTGFVNRWDFNNRTFNRVTVLEEANGALRPVGQTADLAERERIQSARFMGDKGYLVTFEQIDPLFTLDLSDPYNPAVVGELKIPGFSTYLHPLGDTHLLAIGVDLPEPDANGRVDWQERSMKLTIFDVSDLSQPREAHTALIGTAYGWSEAAWEHKAFNYFPARKMLAIPFSDYRTDRSGQAYWESFISDLRLFHIDTTNGITAEGRVDLADVYRTYEYRDWTWYWSPWIRRSVMADDYAYAISDAGIRAVHMERPETPVATVLFDGVATRQP